MPVTFLDDEPQPTAIKPTITFLDDVETTYREDTQSVVSSPVGLSGDQIEHLDDVQNNGLTDDRYFGTVRFSDPYIGLDESVEAPSERSTSKKISDFASILPKSILATLESSKTTVEAASGQGISDSIALGFDIERARRKKKDGVALSDKEKTLVSKGGFLESPLSFMFSGIDNRATKDTLKAISEEDPVKLQKIIDRANKISSSVEKMRKSSDAVIKKHFSLREDATLAERFIFDMFGVGTTIGVSFGVAAVTKSPSTTAVLFGTVAASDAYNESTDAGIDALSKRTISELRGTTEAALEFLGVKTFFKIARQSKGVARALFQMSEEALQEFLQTGTEATIMQGSGVRPVNIKKALNDSLYSALLGFFGSGGAVSVSSLLSKSVEDSGMTLTEKQFDDLQVVFENNLDDATDAMSASIESHFDPVVSNEETEKEAVKIIESFSSGQGVNTESLTEEQLSAIDQKVALAPTSTELITEDQKRKSAEKLRDGRLSKVDADIEVLDLSIDAALQEGISRSEEGRSTKRLDKKIETLERERDALSEERDGLLEEENNSPEFIERAKSIEGQEVILKGAELSRQRKAVERRAVSAINKTIVETRKLTKESVQDAQTSFDAAIPEMKKQVDALDISASKKAEIKLEIDKIFAVKTKGVKTERTLNSALKRVQRQVTSAISKTRKKQINRDLSSALSKKSIGAKKDNGKKKGRFDPERQEHLDRLAQVLKLSPKSKEKGGLSELENAFASHMEDQVSGKIDPDPLVNALFKLRISPQDFTTEEAQSVLDAVNDVKAGGLAAAKKREGAIRKEVRDLREILILAIGAPKLKSDKGGVKVFFSDAYEKMVEEPLVGWEGVLRTKLRFIMGTSDAAVVDGVVEKYGQTVEQRKYEQGLRDGLEKAYQSILKKSPFDTKKALDKYMKRTQQKIAFDEDVVYNDGSEDGKLERLTLTRGQLRKRILELRDDDVRDVLFNKKGNGYTDIIEQKLLDSLDAEGVDLAIIDGMEEFYDSYYEKINEFYKKIYGISLDKVENYSPIKKVVDGDVDNEFLRNLQSRVSGSPASLKSRTGGVHPIVDQDDMTALYGHVNEIEYWINTYEKITVLSRAMRDTKTNVALRKRYGKGIVKSIYADIDYLQNKAETNFIFGEKAISMLVRNFGGEVIPLKPQIGLKQLTSFVAYADNVSSLHFAQGLADLAKNPANAVRIMRKSRVWNDRGIRNLNKDFQDIMNDKTIFTLLQRNKTYQAVAFASVKYGDKGAILFGGYPRLFAQTKAGMSEEQALVDMENKTERTQQSTLRSEQTALQRQGGFLSTLVQFRSSPKALFRAQLDAMLDYKRGRIGHKEFAKIMLIYQVILPNLFAYVAAFGDYDKEDFVINSTTGLLGSGVTFFGKLLETSVLLYHGESPFKADIRNPIDAMFTLSKAVSKIAEDGIEYEEILDGEKNVERLLKGVGGIFGAPLKTAYRDIVGIKNVAVDEGKLYEGFLKLMGYSDFFIKKIMKDKKKNSEKE